MIAITAIYHRIQILASHLISSSSRILTKIGHTESIQSAVKWVIRTRANIKLAPTGILNIFISYFSHRSKANMKIGEAINGDIVNKSVNTHYAKAKNGNSIKLHRAVSINANPIIRCITNRLAPINISLIIGLQRFFRVFVGTAKSIKRPLLSVFTIRGNIDKSGNKVKSDTISNILSRIHSFAGHTELSAINNKISEIQTKTSPRNGNTAITSIYVDTVCDDSTVILTDTDKSIGIIKTGFISRLIFKLSSIMPAFGDIRSRISAKNNVMLSSDNNGNISGKNEYGLFATPTINTSGNNGKSNVTSSADDFTVLHIVNTADWEYPIQDGDTLRITQAYAITQSGSTITVM